jgi:hypothetical protein
MQRRFRMNESGRVLAIAGDKITIAKENKLCEEACFGCLKSGSCGAKPALVIAENPLDLPLTPGQIVETRTGSLFAQALKAILPLPAGFTAGFFLTPLLFPGAGEASRAAGGALLMFAAAAGFYLYRRRFPPKELPRVIRALPALRRRGRR